MNAQSPITLTDALRADYEKLFAACKVKPEKKAEVEAVANKVHAARKRYQAISAATGVPWHVVAAIHLLESGLNFKCHLHNGDPLSGRTTHVPRNRPPGAPPFGFEQSAIDALGYEGFAGWGDWSLSGTLFKLEGYNGFGYRRAHPAVKSPYLWSFTSQYTKGKYGADGKFDPGLVSQQVGAAALFRALSDLGYLDLGKGGGPGIKGLGGPRAAGVPDPSRFPGHVVTRGETDRALVTLIQRRLLELNCGPLDVDGFFEGETESSVKMFQSRMTDRLGRSLGIDGKIGPLTWEALFGSDTVTTVEPHEAEDPLLAKVLTIAESQVGVRETPPNSNRGKEVEAYQKSIPNAPGSAWCASFVYWCFGRAAEQLGRDNPLVRTGGVVMHWVTARGQGVRAFTAKQIQADVSLIRPGQIFIMDHGGGKGHTGLIKRVQGGLVETLEGNTNALGSREGDGVYLKQRTIEEINSGVLDYGARVAPAPKPIQPSPTPTPSSFPDVAALLPSASSGGLLKAAVDRNVFEPPTWVEIPFAGLLVQVGAHALRASVGGKLLRLPVSYQEAIAISNALGWVAPTSALSDAIWRAATVHIEPASQGRWDTEAHAAVSSRKMMTLEYVLLHDAKIEAQIKPARRGELTGSEGKDWILSPRNITKKNAATTYGWHVTAKNGVPIQDVGSDNVPPFHDQFHFDYSQTLRPILRKAIRASTGEEVDLLDELAKGLPAAAVAPFRVGVASGPNVRSVPRKKRAVRASTTKKRALTRA